MVLAAQDPMGRLVRPNDRRVVRGGMAAVCHE